LHLTGKPPASKEAGGFFYERVPSTQSLAAQQIFLAGLHAPLKNLDSRLRERLATRVGWWKKKIENVDCGLRIAD